MCKEINVALARLNPALRNMSKTLLSQFAGQDTLLELPQYDGRIEPQRWQPDSHGVARPR